jgi:16S rRNA (cytosine967-C5)-methyltransferase
MPCVDLSAFHLPRVSVSNLPFRPRKEGTVRPNKPVGRKLDYQPGLVSTKAPEIRPFHAKALVDLVAKSIQSHEPADRLLGDFFRANKGCGSSDRRLIAETVYGVLRHAGRLSSVLSWPVRWDGTTAGLAEPKTLVSCYLITVLGVEPRDMIEPLPFLSKDRLNASLGEMAKVQEQSAEWLSVSSSLPLWLAIRWVAEMGFAEAKAVADSLLVPAPLTIRTNTLKGDRKALMQWLELEGLAPEPCRLSPDAISLERRLNLFEMKAFADGFFEVQDEGSQLIAQMAKPKPGQLVVDGCAGGGGKTLQMAAMMENKGMLYALDTHERRLADLPKRTRRAGVHNVRTQAIGSNRGREVTKLFGKADVVLVDAPCSGSGVLRRNPDSRWKLGEERVVELVALQRTILEGYVPMLKVGGRLVYATCSLLQEENEEQVAWLLAAHPNLQLVNASEHFAKHGLKEAAAAVGDMMNLRPHRHGTDGFFAAIVERTA